MDKKKSRVMMLVATVASLMFGLPGDESLPLSVKLVSSSPQSPIEKVRVVATKITVKVLSDDSLGSGIIIGGDDSVYTVVTNKHVLRGEEPPYQIKTHDGQIHPASMVKEFEFEGYDLALLQFHSNDIVYDVGVVGDSSQLTVGDEIFAAGFPYQPEGVYPSSPTQTNQEQNQQITSENKSSGVLDNSSSIVHNSSFPQGFVFFSGRVSVMLVQALEDGYQIGYNNYIEKGMSGGPLLNSRGEVVGINGKHAFPLWEAPEYYQDGSEACPPMLELINRSNLAIPVEEVVEAVPKLLNYKDIDRSDAPKQRIVVETDEGVSVSEVISQMQVEAEAAQSCTELPVRSKSQVKNPPSPSGRGGSRG